MRIRGDFPGYVKIAEEVVDQQIPLRIVAYKDFVEERGMKSERLRFSLDKGNENSPVAVISGAYLGMSGFELHHRFVEPQFRGKQGVGSMLLKCMESFSKNFATEQQDKVNLFAGVAQLDVIYWFWRNGYRPEERKDWQKLGMILNGDERLCLGDDYYVFEKDIPEMNRYKRGQSGQIMIENGKKVIDPKKAFRLNMAKTFEPEASAAMVDVQAEVRKEIGEELRSRDL